MDKKYDHKIHEQQVYDLWEKSGSFTPQLDQKKKPYTIILPPPNANGKLHIGHALMLAIEDVLVRWKRMQGYSAAWIPGTDHAGFETQVVFEKHLKKEGKSRFDYDRKKLYEMIHRFVDEQKGAINKQIRSLGPSLDWSRQKFTLDEDVIDVVLGTFEKMANEKLVYRDNYIVNYCVNHGTTLADLEVKHINRKDPLYYLKYGPFELATVRPETKFGDTAVAVNPKDKRYKKYVGSEIDVEGLAGQFKLKVIADGFVDMDFGTGVVKVTPAHDKNDYEMGLRHNLEIKPVIGLDGKLNSHAGAYAGMSTLEARERIVNDLMAKGLLIRIDKDYTHNVATCYKCGGLVEPLVMPNWFIKVDSLKKKAKDAVVNKKVNIYPKWQEIKYFRWMEQMRDWPISRQIVWGIRIPAWYSVKENPAMQITFLDPEGNAVKGKAQELIKNYNFSQIEKGLQNLIAPKNALYKISKNKPGKDYLQETDTFDTWYSSAHWPLVTLGYPDSEDFKYFYPTSVLETGWEILRFWVSRMIMVGLYLTDIPPFKDVYLHGLVRASDGRKMSKSLGNQEDPLDYVEKYGADALRAGLISGTANGKDFNFPADKVLAYRNFANKIWNIARFIEIMSEQNHGNITKFSSKTGAKLNKNDEKILSKLKSTLIAVDANLDKYRFSDASDKIYKYMWNDLANDYIESIKDRKDKDVALGVLQFIYMNCLKMLHPFMPFVTESIWQQIKYKDGKLLINSKWPDVDEI